MKTNTKEILDRALDLEDGSQLYITCNTALERNFLYSDLRSRRLSLIKDDQLAKYESVIIDRGTRGNCNAVILTKMIVQSARIRKADGSTVEVTF